VLTDALIHLTMGAATSSTLGPAFSYPMHPYMGSPGPSAAYGNYGLSSYLQQTAPLPQFGGSCGGNVNLPSAFPPASSYDVAFAGGASTSTLAPPALVHTSSAH
jgi:hypothetical protein